MASTTTTSPADTPIFTKLAKNGDFRLEAQQASFIHSFEPSTSQLKRFGYTEGGSDERNAALLIAITGSVPMNGFLKQKIDIPKGGRVAARLMYNHLEAPQDRQFECNMIMTIRGELVASAPANVRDRWMTLEGEVDMDAGEADLMVTFECIATRGDFFVVVDQIVVSDEASLQDLDRVKFVY